MEELTREAFWNLYVPGCNEHLIVHKLRQSADFIPELNFVAEQAGRIVGHIIYTRSRVIGADGTEFATITFGPLSVAPDRQRQGIGTALMRHSTRVAAELGFAAVLIYGYPKNYQSFGFRGASAFRISRGDGRFAPSLMALELRPDALAGVQGRFVESADFETTDEELAEFERGFPPKEKAVTESQSEFSAMVNTVED